MIYIYIFVYIYIYIYTDTCKYIYIYISIFRRKVPETPRGGTGKLWGWTHLTSLWRFPLLAKRVCGKTPCFCCRVPLPTEEIWGECLWWKEETVTEQMLLFVIIYIYLLFLFVVWDYLILHKLLCFLNKKGGSVCENGGFPARMHHLKGNFGIINFQIHC